MDLGCILYYKMEEENDKGLAKPGGLDLTVT